MVTSSGCSVNGTSRSVHMAGEPDSRDEIKHKQGKKSAAPGAMIVGFSPWIQLYDATYFTLSMGKSFGAAGRAGAGIVLMTLVVSRPSLRSGSVGELGA